MVFRTCFVTIPDAFADADQALHNTVVNDDLHTSSSGESAIAPPPVEDLPDGTVDRDLLCRKCGYNLRGLSPAGRCPECGASVAESYRPDLLRYAEPGWLRAVHLGVRLCYIGAQTIAGAFLVIVIATIALAFTAMNQPTAGTVLGVIVTVAAMVMMFVAPLLCAIGLWFSSRPEPRDLEHRPQQTFLFRLVCTLTPVAFVLLWATNWVSFWPVLVVEAIALLCFAIIWANMAMFIGFLQRIEPRCERYTEKRGRQLRRQYRSAKYGTVLILFVHLAIYFFAQPPGSWRFLLIFTGLAWLISISYSGKTLKLIRKEVKAASS